MVIGHGTTLAQLREAAESGDVFALLRYCEAMDANGDYDDHEVTRDCQACSGTGEVMSGIGSRVESWECRECEGTGESESRTPWPIEDYMKVIEGWFSDDDG